MAAGSGIAAAILAATVTVPVLISFSAFALLAQFALTLGAAGGLGAGRVVRWLVAACCLLLAATLPRGVVEAAGAMAIIGLAASSLFTTVPAATRS
jgi:hypothetical protein